MATLPTLPPSGSEDWYAHYSGLHSQGDAQEATLASHASRLSALEGAPAVPLSGVVQVDSFAGATDDIKLDAALLYASQQTRIPYVQMPPRDFTWNKPGRIPFSGMKIIGPNSPGWKNLELASGKYVNHRVSFGAAIGVGNNAAFNGNGQTLYDIYIANLAFAANNNGQLWEQSTGNLYGAEFSSINSFGLLHVIGRPGATARTTVLNTTGVWTVHAYTGQSPFVIGGSDAQLWVAGEMNLQGDGSGNGAWLFQLENMTKTNVGRIYTTAQNGWRGTRVFGDSKGISFWGSTFEGRNAGLPCHGTLFRWEGTGVGAMYGCWFAYGMAAPTTLGGDNLAMLDIRGGSLLVDRPYYDRANGVAETVPFMSVTGATTEVIARAAGRINTNAWTGRPRYTVSGGASVTVDSTFTLI
jgi:hypothetical protein